MKRAFLTILAMSATAAAHAATLRWLNGETMAGDLVAATGTTASWQSPCFESPLVLKWQALQRIDYPLAQTGQAAQTEPFHFSLRDGSAFYGDIVSITGSSVFVHGSRVGDVELKRSEVLAARRAGGGALVWDGPFGTAGWKSDDGELQGGTETEIGPGGSLVLPYFNRKFDYSLPLPLPDAVDVELRVHSTELPDFRFFIGNKPMPAIRIETWDHDVVAVTGSDFQLVRKMDDNERSVALRFTWDFKTRHCAVYTPGGDLLAQWDVPASTQTGDSGFFLRNNGRDLTLDVLRIRKYDGGAIAKYDATHPRLEMDDGSVIDGAVVSGSAGAVQASGTSVALKDVDALVFSNDQPEAKTPGARLTFDDGTLLQGSIVDVKDNAATLQTSFSAEPLTARMDGLRQLRVTSTDALDEPPLSQLDKLVFEGKTLHGHFSTSAGGDGPQWLPLGAVAPAEPVKTEPYEIVRYFPDDAPEPAPTSLFYMRSGDVLSGTLRAVDQAGVELDPGITEHGRLPVSQVEAIQFDARGRMDMDGFNDPAWRIVSGDLKKVQRSGDSITLGPGASIGHPAAMQASDIRFTMNTQTFAAVGLKLFCAGTDPAKAETLLIATTGGQVICGMEGEQGQFEEPHLQFSVNSDHVDVHLGISAEGVTLYLNGTRLETFDVQPELRHGSGLVISAGSVWGNAARSIQLNNFSITSQPGCTWLPDVAPDVREEALTVPRFRREDPPRHALIAANGDVLRGEVEGVTATNFAVRAGMDELTVPRGRVKALIFFRKPVEPAPSATPGDDGAKGHLGDRINGMVIFSNSTFENAMRYLETEAPEIKFKAPKDVGNQRATVRMGMGTVAQALDQLCRQFGFQYEVDNDGAVVIEPATGDGEVKGEGMTEKVYWLKPGAFPGNAPADKTLAAKGIDFPKGASAVLDGDGEELTVENTPDNQQKIAQVLAADFGGAESPGYWLLLRSGARLAIAADHFDKDVITGHNPLYGRCTIPAADVVEIRSWPLEPSPVMKTFDGWKLTYAPEPVLPAAGGDDSAMTGKPAPGFKLNLLSGGQFDLAQQKGKVVVLDFWATWCGPCVNSLPGLIQAMSGFTPDRVSFVAVNQDEPAAHVKEFVEARGWNVNVAMDEGSRVGQQYGASAIPHTVIIGRDGKIAWVKTGSSPGGEDEAAKEVNQLLAAPAAQ
ncbi:MAG TPA: redoxin family protein [Chthoniobacteraceae bacterium]|jgi:peroxiredoxin|nr:redoxin family protein [Chthoniobacteraceae bacterium]